MADDRLQMIVVIAVSSQAVDLGPRLHQLSARGD